MISDGRIIGCPLEKIRCARCGLIRFLEPLSTAAVAAIYATNYGLPLVVGVGEDKRGEAYASVVGSIIEAGSDIKEVLDVGCGTGSMLRFLIGQNPNIQAVGVDPARSEKISRITEKLTLLSGDADTALDEAARFDVVVSINTIEHTSDPFEFLLALRRRVRSGGQIIVICPASEPANCELLFYDHLWTFSPEALTRIANRVDLSVRVHRLLEAPLTGFQMFVLGSDQPPTASPQTEAKADAAVAYLRAWQSLDGVLSAALDNAGGKVQLFGAGQMAALLRAYAPRAFSRVSRLVLDRPEEAWPLGRVESYKPQEHSNGWVTLVGVHPSLQDAVADRIRRDGGVAIAFPAEIRT